MKIRISYQKAAGFIRKMKGKSWFKLPITGESIQVIPTPRRKGAILQYPNGIVLGHDSEGYWYLPIKGGE